MADDFVNKASIDSVFGVSMDELNPIMEDEMPKLGAITETAMEMVWSGKRLGEYSYDELAMFISAIVGLGFIEGYRAGRDKK